MNIVAIVQARMGSTRLPKKVMKEINSTPLIGILLKRLSLSKKIEKIILATSDHDINHPLIKYVTSEGYIVVFVGAKCAQGNLSQSMWPITCIILRFCIFLTDFREN